MLKMQGTNHRRYLSIMLLLHSCVLSTTPLESLLIEHRLEQHHSSFLEHGFDAVEDLRYMTLEDFIHIGIDKRGEQKRAVRAVAQLLQPSYSQKIVNFVLLPVQWLFVWSFLDDFVSFLSYHWIAWLFYLLCFGVLSELILYKMGCLHKCTQLCHRYNPCTSQVVIHVPRDYPTIEAAVDFAKHSHGSVQVIRLAAGRFILKKDLLINVKNGIKISGKGIGLTTIVGMVVVKQARDIELCSLTVMSGNHATNNSSTKAGCGLRVECGGSAIVNGCEVKCCRGCGVEIRERSFLSMTDSCVHHNGWSGVIVIGEGTKATITNLEAYHNENCGLSVMQGACVDIIGPRTNLHGNDGPGLSATGVGAAIRIHVPPSIKWNKGSANGRSLAEQAKKEGKCWNDDLDGEMYFDEGGTIHRSSKY
mgnify:FL=1|jgi:hypothetical protein|tara:strand:- start:56 stop:1312 length:1257 start_codon:yes stop_codon:yes gene_type:complete